MLSSESSRTELHSGLIGENPLQSQALQLQFMILAILHELDVSYLNLLQKQKPM